LATAWQVIKYCGQGDNHPFTYSMDMQVSANDSWGNFSPKLAAENGQQFAVNLTSSGDQLQLHGKSANVNQVEVLNNLNPGAVSANIYKAGKMLARKTNIAPEQKAVFEFKPTIWIGVASQINEGDVMNSAILSNINTELSLLGVASADIEMTGGGPGTGSTPFQFSLQNVVMA